MIPLIIINISFHINHRSLPLSIQHLHEFIYEVRVAATIARDAHMKQEATNIMPHRLIIEVM